MICDTHTTVIHLKDVSSVLGFRANRREKKKQEQLMVMNAVVKLAVIL